MAESTIAQLAMSVFNLLCLTLFGKSLLKKVDDMGDDIQEIKTDVAVMKKEREILNQVCPVRKSNL